jgi:hypothetical protein
MDKLLVRMFGRKKKKMLEKGEEQRKNFIADVSHRTQDLSP